VSLQAPSAAQLQVNFSYLYSTDQEGPKMTIMIFPNKYINEKPSAWHVLIWSVAAPG
jgi:hypothetical protein